MRIRAELPDDLDAVLEVNRRAFADSGHAVAGLVRALHADDPGRLSLVAEDAGRVIGHCLFTRSLLDAPRRLVAVRVLSPLAVEPRWQRRGVGSALVRHGVE